MRLNIDLTQGIGRNVFFVSDFHLFHHNVLRFDNRPFANVHETHLAIETRWNEVVKSNDVVIYLGDLSFARQNEKTIVEDLLKNLNGTIHFVLGNHDKFDEIKRMTRFQSVQDYLEVKITHASITGVGSSMLTPIDTFFCCMHYPIYNWNKSHHGSYMVHGHVHMGLSEGQFHKTLRIFDVGCMGYNYYPISYKALMEIGELRSFNQHH